jgi:hypothetical protein
MRIGLFLKSAVLNAITALALASTTAQAAGQEGDLKSPVYWLRLAARDAQAIAMDKDRGDWNDDQALIGEAQVLAGDLEGAAASAAALLKSAGQASDWMLAAKSRLSAVSLLISCGKNDQTKPLLADLEQLAASKKDPWLIRQLVVLQTRLGGAAAGMALCARLRVEPLPYGSAIVAALMNSDKAAAGKEFFQAHLKAIDEASAKLDPPDRTDMLMKLSDELSAHNCFDQAWAALNASTFPNSNMALWKRRLMFDQFGAGQEQAARVRIRALLDGINLSSPEALDDLIDLLSNLNQIDDAADAVEVVRRAQPLLANTKAPADTVSGFHSYSMRAYGMASDLAGVKREIAIVENNATEIFPAVPIALAEAGDPVEAQKLALKIDARERPRVLVEIYFALLRSSQVDEAIRMFPGGVPPGSEADVAHAMVRKGEFQKLPAWVHTLRSPAARGFAELGAAEALLKAVSANTLSSMPERFIDTPPRPIGAP